ncbi:MAG: hypothetical protein OSB07_12350 [Dehalococcoidia bacterium]|nr:hypothetical protein [Dehalococcoidia bacterium]
MAQPKNVTNLVTAHPSVEHAWFIHHQIPSGAQGSYTVGTANLLGIEPPDETGIGAGQVKGDTPAQLT